MIAAFLLFLAAQDVPKPVATAPAEDDQYDEIVVKATYGTTTMLFDKGSDNKLRNCRIMVSSGSQKRDTNACQATPVCYEKTADQVTDCVALTAIEPSAIGGLKGALGTAQPPVFDMPKLVQPKPAPLPGTLGPALAHDDPDSDRQRAKKLPPPPKNEGSGPVIRFGNVEDK
ncbi:MAG: hypothetical protein KF730_02620 [Sphingomonas sp.]|uniref:hypothetical protein n=1 Tax=Sphingomonas sp. TaxID=28214 RepID=UPI0025DF8890|nr:hypothetical protein [Sphingomonas sp.]MBX3563450.1 hypothetical protein [Sphingomonas sp.]